MSYSRYAGLLKLPLPLPPSPKKGVRPLVKPVQQSKDIHYMVAVFQIPETGEIVLSGDVRIDSPGKRVMGYTLYYPYHFPNPFATYLLPSDLEVGKEVWIEDIVAVWGNQVYRPRLEATPAICTGKDFQILFDPERDAERWIG